MPSAITCPSCRRVLNLPAEAMNRAVQCPACKHQFHPAGAMPAEAVRPALPTLDVNSGPIERAPPTPPIDRRPPPPPTPPPSFEIRRSDRRSKRESQDICPQCKAFVPRGVNKCRECGAEFAPDDDENYRPWEAEGVERRDSEPHRGTMLMIMGITSIVMACSFFICYLGVVTTLMGLGMAIATVSMGRADLRKMDAHAMNADGRGTVHGAMVCAIVGLVLNALGVVAAIGLTASVA